MPNSTIQRPCMTLSELLKEERDAHPGEMSHKFIGFCFGVKESQAAEILNNDAWQSKIEQLRHLLHSPLGRLFIAALTCGTDIDITVSGKRDLDLNGDGKVNMADAMHAVNAADREMSDALASLLSCGPNAKIDVGTRACLQRFYDRAGEMLQAAKDISDQQTAGGPQLRHTA